MRKIFPEPAHSIAIERQTVEDTITDLSESQTLLTRERDSINNRISAIDTRIKVLRVKLEQPVRNSNGKGNRLRKGEAVATIERALIGETGISQVKISEKTGITGASVYRTLTKHTEKFIKDANNLWRLKT